MEWSWSFAAENERVGERETENSTPTNEGRDAFST